MVILNQSGTLSTEKKITRVLDMSPKLIRDVVGLFWNQKVIASEIYSIILDLHNNYSHCQQLLALVRDELKS